MKEDILIQNAKIAVEYWQRIANGEKHEDVKKDYQYRATEGKVWHALYTENNQPPYFEDCRNVIRKKPKHWDLMQEYEKYAKDNPEEYKNWESRHTRSNVWGDSNSREVWNRLCTSPIWTDKLDYRRNPVEVKKDREGCWEVMSEYDFFMETAPEVDLRSQYGWELHKVRITSMSKCLTSTGFCMILEPTLTYLSET